MNREQKNYIDSLNNSLLYSLENIKHFESEIKHIKKRIAYEKRCVKLIKSNIKKSI